MGLGSGQSFGVCKVTMSGIARKKRVDASPTRPDKLSLAKKPFCNVANDILQALKNAHVVCVQDPVDFRRGYFSR
jgi:hypothetical protein